MKILVVDDEQEILYIIQEFLQWRTHCVVTASHGREGLHEFMEDPASFDIIISDVNMPCMDGLEMVRQIRQQHFSTPVLFVTASEMPRSAAEQEALHPFTWLEKPFELAKMETIAMQHAAKYTNAAHRNAPSAQSVSSSTQKAPRAPRNKIRSRDK